MEFYDSDDYYYSDYDDEDTLDNYAASGPKMCSVSRTQPQSAPSCPFQQKEKFVSSGTMGATYNEDMDTITGPALYTNHMLQNGTTWKQLKNDVKRTGTASDGSKQLGVGTGNSYDASMQAHIRNMEIMESASNEYNNPELLRQITKNINDDLSSSPENSMYDRANQTCGKMIELNNRAIGVLPEEFLPEREKNRNIYKAQEIIPIPGFNVNIERLGSNLSESHPVLYSQRSHRRIPTALGGTGNLEQHVGQIMPPTIKQSGRQEGFTAGGRGAYAATRDTNSIGYMRGIDGSNYWTIKH